ncbi:MAG TPA: 2-phospho-L-lactate transferase [Chloroflexi bacterium]|nr:MAG: 2-phospho-L-lactate transferase [Chloroflexota bacterium]HDD55509.1 2-phospho-L-lactate transferase [Chloroflexota bacterium]
MKVAALAGGVGGAKLVDGISRLNGAPEMTVIVNTGDDFSLFGLWISPDLDTVCYNLAGLENQATGWGRDQESWETFQEIQALGGPDWFQLGGKDLATHLERTRRLGAGQPLSQITADFCKAWGVQSAVIPMSDDPVPTLVETDQGILTFQEYFVKLGCEPEVKGFEFHNVEKSRPAPGVLDAIQAADLVLICPSNPWVSIDPILAVPGIRSALGSKTVLGVSPIICGEAVKGPAAKMYREMGIQPSAGAVAAHYGDLLDGFVIDDLDRDLQEDILSAWNGSLTLFHTNIWMKTRADRVAVAENIIAVGSSLVKEV